MKSKIDELILVVDDDPISQTINLSLFKSLPVVKEIKLCQNGMEALKYIIQLKKECVHTPKLILLDLKKPKIGENKFLEVFNKLNNPKRNNSIVTVLYTPDFFEDNQNISLPGYEIILKHHRELKNSVILDFYEDIQEVTIPGFDVVEKSGTKE